MSRGEKVKWRRSEKTLFTKPIYREEFPKLIKRMKDDDLIPFLEEDGLKWYHGRYEIAPKILKNVWGLSQGQYNRLVDYILEEGVCDWE